MLFTVCQSIFVGWLIVLALSQSEKARRIVVRSCFTQPHNPDPYSLSPLNQCITAQTTPAARFSPLVTTGELALTGA
jgi:hypothetical protein